MAAKGLLGLTRLFRELRSGGGCGEEEGEFEGEQEEVENCNGDENVEGSLPGECVELCCSGSLHL